MTMAGYRRDNPIYRKPGRKANVKLAAHRAGFPGNEISFLIVPLDPAYKAELAGALAGQRGDSNGRRRVG